MLEYNSKVLTYGGKWLEEDLSCSVPPGVFRFVFSDPYFDPIKSGLLPYNPNGSFASYETYVDWKRVCGKPNVWDCILTNPYGLGTWDYMFDQRFGSSYSHTPFVCDVALVAGNFNYSDSGPNSTNVSHIFGNNYSLRSVGNLTFRAGQETTIFFNSENIDGAYLPNVNNTTSLSGMFAGVGLKYVKIGDLSNITNMQNVFAGNNLEHVELYGTQNVTNWSGTFADNAILNSVYIESTASATRMDNMFQNCTSLRKVQDYDTSNVTNMRYMFSGCTQLQQIPSMDTSSATDVTRMFDCCYDVRGVPEFYTQLTSQATPPSSHYMCFRQTGTLSWRRSIDWSWGGITNANKWTFTVSSSTIDLRDHNYATMSFSGSGNVGTGEANIIQIEQDGADASKYYYYTSADGLQPGYDDSVYLAVYSGSQGVPLRYALTATQLPHQLHYTTGMFSHGHPGLTTAVVFDTSSVTNMDNMFKDQLYLTAVPLYDVSSATSMNYTFAGCRSVESGALDMYDAAKDTVSSHTDTFEDCGIDTVSGSAELAQIPTTWGGTAT